MQIISRAVTNAEKDRCIWIEKGATPGLSYISDTWEDFISGKTGELIGAYKNGELGGIGKITKLYDKVGWLETLRVHPDYQGIGLGKAIYDRYMALMPQMDLMAVGMYTNLGNIKSKSLAEKYGLKVAGRFTEYKKPAPGAYVEDTSLKKITAEAGEAFLLPYYKAMGSFIVINRTFYPVSQGLGKAMAEKGFLYGDDNGNVLISGARFQPGKSIHIAYLYGEMDKLLNFSMMCAAQAGSGSLTFMAPYGADRKIFEENGFSPSREDFITLWRGLEDMI